MNGPINPDVHIPEVIDRARPIDAIETGIPLFIGYWKDSAGATGPVEIRSLGDFEKRFGQPRYRLSFDRRREAWYLDADQDGDGRYDTRQQFQVSGAAW